MIFLRLQPEERLIHSSGYSKYYTWVKLYHENFLYLHPIILLSPQYPLDCIEIFYPIVIYFPLAILKETMKLFILCAIWRILHKFSLYHKCKTEYILQNMFYVIITGLFPLSFFPYNTYAFIF